ncbi:hypothetical protein X777_13204 [Ooceraea biroi]|uniref:DUF8207 domain-containing protein n=1 Tax=Ooceraea biroi TaxID=2015173 RepID=A0A026WZK9_OOCBI|nr:hypothetical protein X777_13204 [Ooceraea biroi]
MSSGAAAPTLQEREAIVEEITRARESICRKHRSLRTGRMEDEQALESHFKPIVGPLKRLVEHTINDEPDAVDVTRVKRKFEEAEEDADASAIVTPLKIGRQRLSATSSPLISATLEADARGRRTGADEPAGAIRRRDSGRDPASKTSVIDNVYGVYIGKTGTMLGDKRFDVSADDSIFVGGVRYEGRPGLYELIFIRAPDESAYTVEDMTMYRRILLVTNAHRQRHQTHRPIKSNKGYKYRTIIAPLISVRLVADHSGAGVEPPLQSPPPPPPTMRVTGNAVDYVHWDDLNELVDRLRLIEASRGAGNDSHDAEFLSIIEELLEAGIITI